MSQSSLRWGRSQAWQVTHGRLMITRLHMAVSSAGCTRTVYFVSGRSCNRAHERRPAEKVTRTNQGDRPLWQQETGSTRSFARSQAEHRRTPPVVLCGSNASGSPRPTATCADRVRADRPETERTDELGGSAPRTASFRSCPPGRAGARPPATPPRGQQSTGPGEVRPLLDPNAATQLGRSGRFPTPELGGQG
jgi:hypothetical protein